MTYNAILEMANDPHLRDRIAAAAAAEGVEDPPNWVQFRRWKFATQPGWADAWLFASENTTVNQNPNTGQRDDVINDAMILASVQAIRTAEEPA